MLILTYHFLFVFHKKQICITIAVWNDYRKSWQQSDKYKAALNRFWKLFPGLVRRVFSKITQMNWVLCLTLLGVTQCFFLWKTLHSNTHFSCGLCAKKWRSCTNAVLRDTGKKNVLLDRTVILDHFTKPGIMFNDHVVKFQW